MLLRVERAYIHLSEFQGYNTHEDQVGSLLWSLTKSDIQISGRRGNQEPNDWKIEYCCITNQLSFERSSGTTSSE